MTNIKNRIIAFLIALIVIVGSTVFSVHRFLGGACQEVTDSFYNGVYNSDWNTTRPSLNKQLNNRYDAANGLYAILAGYPDLSNYTEALRIAKNTLKDATGIHEKYLANQQLEDAFAAALHALQSQPLDGRDQEMLKNYSENFSAARDVIAQCGYNESVREFYRSTLNVFPANLLRHIIPQRLPVLFE